MKSPRFQLALAGVLFCVWLGWLVYLALTNVRPTVLSRPQFLVANLYVIAQVSAGPSAEGPANDVVVREVLWSEADADRQLETQELFVKNLAECGAKFGWTGASEYVLALTKTQEADKKYTYQVTPLPRSPGFVPPAPDPKTQRVPSLIYRLNPETIRQARDLVAEFHPQ
jgi:hypothetical protein